jgi:hypothetical protein
MQFFVFTICCHVSQGVCGCVYLRLRVALEASLNIICTSWCEWRVVVYDAAAGQAFHLSCCHRRMFQVQQVHDVVCSALHRPGSAG